MKASLLALFSLFLFHAAVAAAAPDPADKCVAAKMTAGGKHFVAISKCRAKAVLAGTAVDPDCVQKAGSKLQAAFAKAESHGTCTVTGDATTIDDAVGLCVDTVDGDLARLCGDGVIAPSEACDDGNATSGDGCSATCGREDGWDCGGEPTACTCSIVASLLPTERGHYAGDLALDATGSYSGCGLPLQYVWTCRQVPGRCNDFEASTSGNTNAMPTLWLGVDQLYEISLTVCFAGTSNCASTIHREYQGFNLP
jgi:cysteine-rich repeat protein